MAVFKPASIGKTGILSIKKNGEQVSRYRPDLGDAEIDISSAEKTTTTGKFTTSTGGKLESCIVAFNPVQSGSGDPSPSNVRPITGHSSVEVNIYGENFFANLTKDTSKGYKDDYYLTYDGTENSSGGLYISEYLEVKANTEYYVGGLAGNSPALCFYTENKQYISGDKYSNRSSITLTTPSNAKYMRLSVMKSNEDLYTVRYSKSCEVTVNLGGTYYGGTLDVVSGKLTVDKGYLTENDLSSINSGVSTGGLHWTDYIISAISNPEVKCNKIKTVLSTQGWSSTTPCIQEGAISASQYSVRIYCTESTLADFKTTYSGLQIVYNLPSPQVIQLTPQQINTLIGENNIDVPMTGQSLDELTYREMFAWDDVEDVVEEVDAKKADISVIGTDESGRTTASKAYAYGDIFYKDGKLCRAYTAIAQGATLTLNTNYGEEDIARYLRFYKTQITPSSGISLTTNVVSVFGKIVDVLLQYTTPSDMSNNITLGGILKPFNDYAFLDAFYSATPYEKCGSVFIRGNTGEIVLPRGIPASTSIWISGTYITKD